MPCPVDLLTNLTCGGNGVCSHSDPTHDSARCICAQFFDEVFNCTQTDFYSQQVPSRVSSMAFLVIYGVLFLCFVLELFPDFYFRHGVRAFKKPFSLAKICALVFLIVLSLDMIFYILNDGPESKSSLKLYTMYIVSHSFVVATIGILVNLIFLSWIEIIERGRSLDNVKWIKPFRITSIVLTVLVIVLNTVTLPLLLIHDLRNIVSSVNTSKTILSGIVVLVIMCASIFALIRGRRLWTSKTVSSVVAFKSRAFITLIVILVGFLIVTIISAFGEDSSGARFVGRMFFNGSNTLLLIVALLFLQSNLFQRGKFFIGFTSSYNSHPSNRTTTGSSNKNPRSNSNKSVSKKDVELTAANTTTTTTIEDTEASEKQKLQNNSSSSPKAKESSASSSTGESQSSSASS